MVQRYPSAQVFANSTARVCLQFRLNGRVQSVELRSLGVTLALGLIAAVMAVYLVVSCYLVFRDEMLAKLLTSQAETQYAYEDRIAALRAHLDRVATKQLINQDSFEDKVSELIARQSQLETRQAIVSTLAFEAQRQGLRKLPMGGPSTAETGAKSAPPVPANPQIPARPTPLVDAPQKTSLFSPVPDLRLGEPLAVAQGMTPDALAGVTEGLARIEMNQLAAVNAMQREASSVSGKWRGLVADIGLDQGRFAASGGTQKGEVGGPLVPLSNRNGLSAFDQSVLRLQYALSETAKISSAMKAIPLEKPLAGEVVVTSAFGARSDPFMHSAALHTGLDFRGGYGSPVKATAPGKVIGAGMQGGYGNMVEVDHGYGLTTRYAHLSSIAVDVGDRVEAGEVVGHIGSTGRSTGPHLHYETRIDGEATDPMRFLQAASRLSRS